MSPGFDFWQWAALTGLGLTGLGVILAGVGLWTSTRQTKAITGQIGATAQLSAEAEARTQTTLAQMQTATQAALAQMEERTRTTLAQMDSGLKQVLDRMDARAEARARDLRDRLGGEEGQV